MIRIVSSTEGQLVAKDRRRGVFVIAIAIVLVGLGLLALGLLSEMAETGPALVAGVVAIAVGVLVYLLRTSHTYIFDKQAGQLTWAKKSVVRNNQEVYALADISHIGKTREYRQRSDRQGLSTSVAIKYSLRFANGESIDIARKQYANLGTLVTLAQSALSQKDPRPIEDIANFLGVEVRSIDPRAAGMIKNAVGALMGN